MIATIVLALGYPIAALGVLRYLASRDAAERAERGDALRRIQTPAAAQALDIQEIVPARPSSLPFDDDQAFEDYRLEMNHGR